MQKDECRKSIKDFFSKLSEVVKKAELQCYQKFEKLHKKIERKTYEYNNLDVIEEKILKHQYSIHKFVDKLDEEFNETRYMKLINHKNKYFKDMMFPENHINFKSKNSLLNKIEDIIKTSWNFELVRNEGKEMKKKVKKSFSLRDSWFCLKCLKKNSNKKHPIE